jgi:hypothetical protein
MFVTRTMETARGRPAVVVLGYCPDDYVRALTFKAARLSLRQLRSVA